MQESHEDILGPFELYLTVHYIYRMSIYEVPRNPQWIHVPSAQNT
jgi:hypothetical protein